MEEIPEYEVSKTNKNVGETMLDELIVLTPSVELNNSLFMVKIKKVFIDIAKKNKSPNFMTKIYTDRQVMEWNESLDYNQSIAVEMLDRRNTHLVATYVGGFYYLTCTPSTEDDSYYINWFDGAFTTDPLVGSYVGVE